jgi:hypothetical protein
LRKSKSCDVEAAEVSAHLLCECRVLAQHLLCRDEGETEFTQGPVEDSRLRHSGVGILRSKAEARGSKCIGEGEGLRDGDGELVAWQPKVANGGESEQHCRSDDEEGEQRCQQSEVTVGLADSEGVLLERECVQFLDLHRNYSYFSSAMHFHHQFEVIIIIGKL